MLSWRMHQQVKHTQVLEKLLAHDNYEKYFWSTLDGFATNGSKLSIMLKKPPEPRWTLPYSTFKHIDLLHIKHKLIPEK